MTKLTVEYLVTQDPQVPDEEILRQVVELPWEMTLTGPNGKQYKVLLTPELAYPTHIST